MVNNYFMLKYAKCATGPPNEVNPSFKAVLNISSNDPFFLDTKTPPSHSSFH